MNWFPPVAMIVSVIAGLFYESTLPGKARVLEQFIRGITFPLTDTALTAIPRRLFRASVGGILVAIPALLVFILTPQLLGQFAPPILLLMAASALTLVLCIALARRLLAAPQLANDSLELAWDDALRTHAIHTVWVAPLATGAAATLFVINLSDSGTQSPPILEFILATTVMQALLQLSRPGKRFRRRLWLELAIKA